MARFWELLRCVGVDELAQPNPGMIVPFGGSNFVALQTDGKRLRVASDNRSLEVKEVEAMEIRKKRVDVNIALSQPGVDEQFKAAMMPDLIMGQPRFFEIIGKKIEIGFPGAKVQAFSDRKLEATLQVVVLKESPVRIAIRNVTVPARPRDSVHLAEWNILYHSDKPCDPDKELADMNAVWQPQANIVIKLVPSESAMIDDRVQATREALARGAGIKDLDKAEFRRLTKIDTDKTLEVFKGLKVKDAHATLFLIHGIHDGGSGRMYADDGVGFIAGTHFPTSFAHEVGHFLRGPKDAPRDERLLMRGGGAGWKIPFELVKTLREVSAGLPAIK